MKFAIFFTLLTFLPLLNSDLEWFEVTPQKCPVFDHKIKEMMRLRPREFLVYMKNRDDCRSVLLDSLQRSIVRQRNVDEFDAMSSICALSDGALSEEIDVLSHKIFRAEPDFFIQYCLDKPTQSCIYNSLLDEISASIATYRKDQRQTQIALYTHEIEAIINTKPNAKRNLEFFRTKIVAKIDPAKFD